MTQSLARPSTVDEITIDVRQIARSQRHPLIFATYDRIAPQEFLRVVSDHDPRPLRYLFDVKHPGTFTWDYLEEGPEVWHVRIGRSDALRSPVRGAAPDPRLAIARPTPS